MKRSISLALLLAFLLSACGTAATATLVPTSLPPTEAPTVIPTSAPAARTLNVFAAASLTDAFKEIGQAFEAANPGVTVMFNFAGSQTLVTQIQQGAPADVFASASGTNMDAVVTGGYVDKAAPQVFLTNILLVILPSDNPANVQTLQDLAKPGLKVVLADASVPAGKYARQILDNMSKDPTYGTDFGTKVLANVVSNETDVKQVVAKVQLGEADAGIVDECLRPLGRAALWQPPASRRFRSNNVGKYLRAKICPIGGVLAHVIQDLPGLVFQQVPKHLPARLSNPASPSPEVFEHWPDCQRAG